MKDYKNKITLIKNKRGCYILDTIKGCSICKIKKHGCYDDCYAKKKADIYKFNFNNPIERDFKKDNSQLYFMDFFDTKHLGQIIKQIKNIDMPFIRIGETGDPSENWEHTINICKEISITKIPIVIITKHLKTINNELLNDIKKLNICINTSISALDNDNEIKYRLNQYNKLDNYCNSVLRVVSCDFNKKNKIGLKKSKIQESLFNNKKVVDTIFRPNIYNSLVTFGIINIKKVKFLKSFVWASVYNKNTYLGYCNNCKDMCGITLE